MRYKNPQLVSQHYFIASFGPCFMFFTWCDQLVAQQKCLMQVEESCCEKIKCGPTLSNNFGLARFSQTHNLKYNKFAHAVWQVESFCISYFSALGKMTHTCILKLFPWESLPTSHTPLTLAFSSRALRLLVVPPCLSTNYFGTKIHKTVHNSLLL